MKKTGVKKMNFERLRVPGNLSAAASDADGEINLQWEPVSGAKYYIIQSAGAAKQWKEIDIVSRTTYTASQLRSGRKYSFRIAAVGSAGMGEWSKEAIKKSP